MQIQEIIKKYSAKIDYIDLELILAHSLNKTREFILTYPEYSVNSRQNSIISKNIRRRVKGEPIAYIVGHKEFYGLDFMVDKSTLIPRPETEQLVKIALDELKVKSKKLKVFIADIGTGSGNIIISIAKTFDTKYKIPDTRYYAIDISKNALAIARKNAENHGVDKKIKFFQGDLLTPLLKANKLIKLTPKKLVVVANLPYLSKEIYKSAPIDVKKYEPKSALHSTNAGLAHYEKLLKQIKNISKSYKLEAISCFLEFSPEQKRPLEKLIKNILPQAKIFFAKDLAGKWRICKIEI